ncbi:hypothetical protein S40285_07534 [Stachybotrys chlorohalonatus IBT 40285]|uniref:Vta1 C-terminal domain-containing protein n=1 Tax=Stachybotrys chlorohalonatus (strain IBT 40285) TaxID=1283841 RepID=A0A084QCY0_STAC4|nr:hypothetical protein S40285_07534 [Stachybotrys chlorohalonata IBT 40285]
MAEAIPAALRIPEVSRFLKRANQLRTFNPAVAYWCEYHAVNVIVGKSLHTVDDATFNYTRTLIERLETTKAEHASNDAIVDNTAGQAYVEQFAQDTFNRAEVVLRSNKVTRQTADTFDAAATFFDLTHEWGTPEPEVLKKIKFAKWNAARILKAIRNGEDPNESNPQMPEPEQEQDGLDPTEAELQALTSPSSGPAPVSVEDAPDAGEPPLPPVFSPPPAAPTKASEPPASANEPSLPSPANDGYFPTASPPGEPFVPSPMSTDAAFPSGNIPPAPSFPEPSPQASLQPSAPFPPTVSTPTPNISAPPSWTTTPSVPHPASVNPPPAAVGPAPNLRATPSPAAPSGAIPPSSGGGFSTSHKDINQAQKHAKWAISALNFDDVTTAVQELRNALSVLGAL